MRRFKLTSSGVSRIRSVVRRIIRFIRALLSRIVKFFKSGDKLALLRTVAKHVVPYVLAASTSTYGLTALTTPAHLLKPAEVLPIVERAGVLNWATFGAALPIMNGAKRALGDAANSFGSLVGSDSLVATGTELANQASEWFEEGMGTFSLDGLPKIDLSSVEVPSFDFGKFLGLPSSSSNDDDENPLDLLSGDSLVAPIDNSNASSVDAVSPEVVAGRRWTQFDIERFPNYYRIIDEPVEYDIALQAGEIYYEGIDGLGRTGRAVASVTYAMVAESSGWRASFKADADSISGWGHNAKASIQLYNGDVYNGWFWNRSHLIADSLGGYDHVYTASGDIDKDASQSERRNLICGTRMQNVGTNNVHGSGYGGMAYFERMAVDYLSTHQNCSIWYSAEPIYEGDELIPRSVIVKAKSCDGGLDVQAEVFNAAYGYDIDYHTGEFSPASQ